MPFGIQNTFTCGATESIRAHWHLCMSHRVAPGLEIDNDEMLKKSYPRLKHTWVHVKLGIVAWHFQTWPPRCTSSFHIISLVFDCACRKIIVSVQPWRSIFWWVPPWPHYHRDLVANWRLNSSLVVSPSSRLTCRCILWHIGHTDRSIYLWPIVSNPMPTRLLYHNHPK